MITRERLKQIREVANTLCQHTVIDLLNEIERLRTALEKMPNSCDNCTVENYEQVRMDALK